ncbi:MAG: DUF262 domain-containing protein [Lachnospiraceae bacterium]|nr:DUF262 domain-containing protein [Lachnospiraceae bacterium]
MAKTIVELLKQTKEYEDNLIGFESEDISNEDLQPIPYPSDDIRISQHMYSIYQIYYWIDQEILVLQPDFQRNQVWDVQRKSLLIESVMLRIPIPAFYFQEDSEGNKMVIDGLQRLSAIYAFMQDGFRLKGLQYLQDCEKLTYSELPKKYRIRIQETQLAVNILDSRCSERVKFDVFRRVNTGGVPLNSQEIRNIMANNAVRQLLRNMSQSEEFIMATRGRVHDIRMDAQELCLRFIAFYIRYDNHQLKDLYSLAPLLDEIVVMLNRKSSDELLCFETVFCESMAKCAALLGETAFSKKNSTHIINKPLFISWSVILAYRTESVELLRSKRDEAVRLQYQYFQEGEYFNAITSSTTTRRNIRLQFEAVERILEELFS